MPNAIPNSENITRKVLDNGIVVLVRENHDVQSVVVNGAFAAGSTFEPEGKHGVAAITAEALLRGTQTHDFANLHETLESSGISLDFSGGRFMTSFNGKSLAEDMPLLVQLIGDALRNPTFPDTHIDLIKGELITGLSYNQQNTRYVAAERFRQLAYPESHVYHRSPSGTIESVQALTRDDVVTFHQQQYGVGQMIIAIVGAIDTQAAVDAIQTQLGDWQNPTQQSDFTQPAIAPLTDIQFEMADLAGKTQSDLILGVVGPSRTDTNYQAARMANNILGVFGMMGRLGKSVREDKGLAYYSSSSLEGGLSNGAWRVSAGVNPQNLKLAVDSIRLEIDNMVEAQISAEDLADNKANFTGRLPLLLETNGGVANHLIAMERYGLGLDYLQNYTQMIDAITIADVQSAMQTYWGSGNFSLAVAGPAIDESIL